MEMTITEKILAYHAGRKFVEPGEFILADVDLLLANDITAPMGIKEFRSVNGAKVFDKEKIVLVLDHFVPNKDIMSAMQSKYVRDFAMEQGIRHFYEGSDGGIEHALLPEKGLVVPGDLIIGADSHTCTYGGLGAFSTGVGSTDFACAMLTGKVWLKVPQSMRIVFKGKKKKWVYGKDLILTVIARIGVDGALYRAMEFHGDTIKTLPIHERLTIANMAIEAGGKNGIFHVDEVTKKFIKKFSKKKPRIFKSDKNAKYAEEVEIDVSKIEPVVAFPHLPENVKNVEDARGIEIQQVVIGSCTNGWLEDLRIAAKILSRRKVKKGVRCIIFPATYNIFKRALKEGLIGIFIEAGAIVSPPTCGPCLGGHMGVLAEGERAISTTNRNFIGRMGHTKSEVYLANPAVAAASAVLGRIAHPDEVE